MAQFQIRHEYTMRGFTVQVLQLEDDPCYEFQIINCGECIFMSEIEAGNPATAAAQGFAWLAEEAI